MTVNVSLGTTSIFIGDANSEFTANSGALVILGTATTNTARIELQRFASGTNPIMAWRRSVNATPNGHAITDSDRNVMQNSFYASNGTDWQEIARFECLTGPGSVNGTAGSAYFRFRTANDTSTTLVSRFYIQGNGQVVVANGGYIVVGRDDLTGDYVKITNNSITISNSTSNVTIAAGGRVLLATNTPSNQATVDFTSLAGYRSYTFEIENLVPRSNSDLLVRVDVGSGFDSTSTRYVAVTGSNVSTTTTAMNICIDGTVPVANGGSGISGRISAPDLTTSTKKHFTWNCMWQTAASWFASAGGGAYTFSSANVISVRFLFATGNVSTGTIRAYGNPN